MKEWLQKNGWVAGLTFASVLALLSFVFPSGLFTRWGATGVLLFALPLLWKAGLPQLSAILNDRYPRVIGYVKNWWPYIIVALGGLLVLGPVTLGQMPVSQDHANHYYATHILVHEMIPSFRFFGWTDSLGTGYPFGDLYHTPSYLVTGLLHLITFGGVSLKASYAFGMVIVLLVLALSVTAWAKRLAGSHGAVFAGLLVVLDKGGDREGGWIYSMFHGVWPQSLGVGLWLFALLAFVRLAEKPSTRRLAASVLLGGFSLWVHPMNALTMVIAGFLLMAILVLVPGNKDPATGHRGAAPLFFALLFSGLLGLVWVGRMMLAGDDVYAYPSNWRSVAELTRSFLEGGPFAHQFIFVGGLAFVGVVALLRKGGRFATFAIILPAALIVIGSMDLILGSDLGLLGGSLSLVQYRRFSIPAKPLWYALSGVGVAFLISSFVSRAASKTDGTSLNLVKRGVVALFLAPFVFAIALALPSFVETPVANPLTLKRTGDANSVNEIRRALLEERSRCKDKYCKAVYWEKPGHGGLYPVLALADTGFEWHSTLKLPANNFKRQNPSTNFEALKSLGVSVVVSKWKHTHELLEKIGTYGRHHVYRMKGPIPSHVRMDGPGKVSVTSWGTERRVAKVSGSSNGSSLIIATPPYRKWHASQGGRELNIDPFHRGGLVLSEITGFGDGDVIIEYEDSLFESGISILGFIIALGSIALLFLRPMPLPLLDFFERKKSYLLLKGSVLFLFVAFGLFVFFGGRGAVLEEWLVGEGEGVAVEKVLHRESLVTVNHYPKDHCLEAYVRNPNWSCSQGAMATDLVPAKRRGGKMPSCLATGIPKNGHAELVFDFPRSASKIEGRFQVLGKGGPVTGLVKTGSSEEAGTPLSVEEKKAGSFSIPVVRGTDQVKLVFSSKSKVRICVEAVALSN